MSNKKYVRIRYNDNEADEYDDDDDVDSFHSNIHILRVSNDNWLSDFIYVDFIC